MSALMNLRCWEESRGCDEEGEMDGVVTLYNVFVRAKPWFCLSTKDNIVGQHG